MVPAFPPMRNIQLPGMALYKSSGVYSSPANVKLEMYDLPTSIADIEAGHRKPAFNPWKTRNNYRQRLHEMLFLEEVCAPRPPGEATSDPLS